MCWQKPRLPKALRLSFLALLLGCLVAVPARAEIQPEGIWDEAGIEDFTLTNADGKEVSRKDLLGRPWLACFVFTRCATTCPRVTTEMRKIQAELPKLDPKLRLVSFTVDPDFDTPEVLREWRAVYSADPEIWTFLTGDKRVIYGLIHNSFKMPVQEMVAPERKPGFEVIHSNNIMYVDAQGRVRGKFNAVLDEDMLALRSFIRAGGRQIPEWTHALPTINASLNGLATILLVAGYLLIKLRQARLHKYVMLSAFGVSTAFLVCYLLYHYYAGSRRFSGSSTLAPFYYGMLISHIVLAATVPVLAIWSIARALKGNWMGHRFIARITLPIWLYVSVTGVAIYVMLYHM